MRLKKIKKNPNYNRTAKLARQFMISQNINKLPVNPFEIARKNNWGIEKASEVAKDINVSVDYLLNNIIRTKDGAAIYCKETDEYSILYNDCVKNFGRIRWTMTHEIGHIILKHHNYDRTIISRGGLSKSEYYVLEKEADFFASLVLAPPIVLNEINIKNPNDIQKVCKLSKQASENRFNYYTRWKTFTRVPTERIIRDNFYDFIYQKKCNNCGHWFISEIAIHCPICSEKLEWGKGNMKYNDFIELNENGRALICPKCENGDFGEEDKYCKICGTYLYQRCTGKEELDINGNPYWVEEPCNVILDSNARFCTQCGRPTTFSKHLDGWEKEKEKIEAEEERILFGDKPNKLSKELTSVLQDIDDDIDVPF